MFQNGFGGFFAGRYGFDKLFYGLIAVQAALVALAWLFGKLGFSVGYYICFSCSLRFLPT